MIAFAAANSNTVAIVTIIVAGIVGVVGPVVTGVFLWLTTGRTISAERERHRDELSFQRGETDLAELRKILDALAEHVFAIKEGVDDVVRAAQWREEERAAELKDLWENRHEEGTLRLATELDQAAQQIQRARLRLGSSADPVARAAALIRHHGEDVRLRLPGGLPPDAWRGNLEAAQHTQKDLAGLVDEFVTRARKFSAARLHEEPPPTAPAPKPWPRTGGVFGAR